MNNFVCVINLQHIFDILWTSWAFSLALDFLTHQNTSYFDLRIRVYMEKHHTITNLHGCASNVPMTYGWNHVQNGILTSWHYFVIIGRFAFLVCRLTELEIWPSVLLTLWPDFKILCMTIVLFFVFGAKRINSTLSWSTSITRWSTSVIGLIHLLIHRWKESSMKLMRSNIMSCDTMLNLFLSWLVSA